MAGSTVVTLPLHLWWSGPRRFDPADPVDRRRVDDVLGELSRQGLRVPGDLAIVGDDDIDFAAAAAVPLSSISQPREELGRSAAQLLLEEADQGVSHRHRQVVFSPELVVRESSDRSLPSTAPLAEVA